MLLFLDSIFLESQEVVVRVRRDMINVLLEAPLIFSTAFWVQHHLCKGSMGFGVFSKIRPAPKSAEGESF